MDFFISDLHFGHDALLRLERSQFNSIEEHDQFIIDSINRLVKKTDRLYILGDIGNLEKCRQINARKILVVGNHDKRPIKEFESVFAEVYDHPVYLKENIVLSHIPIQVNEGTLNVHGHLHGAILTSKNHLNVSAHMIEYTPKSIHRIYELASRLPKENNKFLEEWFAEQYLFSNPSERNDVVCDNNGRILLKETKEHRSKLFKK